MRRKIILRLSVLIVFLSLLYSCRNDVFPDKEAYNNNDKFRLTSQRISLNESKHKLKLIPEISEAETLLRSVKSNVSGKIIDYGNGTSIDTDHVIYIENGPNYHTYTFNVIREGSSENMPLENLVLSPLSDGTYREILVTYNLTEQEKEILRSGGTVDTKNKVTYLPLETSNFQSGITSKTQDCHLEINFYYTECSENLHSHGEQYPKCKADQPSELVYVITEVCTETSGGSDNPWDPNFPDLPGGGGGGEGGGSTTPCNGNGVLTSPQTPVSGIGYDSGDGCTGIPTSPNLGNPQTPCEKTKSILNKPNVQQGITTVKAQALQTLSNMNTGETGFKEKKDGTTAPADLNSSHKVVYNDVTDGVGGYHNHTANGTHMFSPPDIADTLLGFAAAQNNVSDAYFGMIAAEWCNCPPSNQKYIHYVIQYTGAAIDLGTGGNYNFTAAQMTQFENDYRKTVRNLKNTYINGNTYIQTSGNLNEKGLEKLFFEMLNTMGLTGNINLQRVEANGTIYNVTLDSNNMPTGTPCP